MSHDLSLPDLGSVPEDYFDGGQHITDRVLARVLNQQANATRGFHASIVTANAASTAPGQQPTVHVSGALIILGFTPNTDDAFRQFKIPSHYSGNANLHVHWSKTGDTGEQGNAVKWRVSYSVFPGDEGVAANGAPSTVETEDTYDAVDTTERRIYRTANMPLAGFQAGYYASMKIEAVTPSGTALTNEPGLFSLDLTYDKFINR